MATDGLYLICLSFYEVYNGAQGYLPALPPTCFQSFFELTLKLTWILTSYGMFQLGTNTSHLSHEGIAGSHLGSTIGMYQMKIPGPLWTLFFLL